MIYASVHATGMAAAASFGLVVAGLLLQVRVIHRRRAQGQNPVAVLSLNQFFVTFLSFIAFALCSSSIGPVGGYVLWPRIVGAVPCAYIIVQIALVRRDAISWLALASCGLLTAVLGYQLLVNQGEVLVRREVVAIVASAVLLQGYAHQVFKLHRSGYRGAVSVGYHSLVLLKDIAMLAFAAGLPWDAAWPLVLMSGSSALTKVAVLLQCARLREVRHAEDS